MSLRETLDTIRTAPVPRSEEAAKFQIIAPVLKGLGWDAARPQDVLIEHAVGGKGGGKVDIALKGPDHVVALLEAKAPGQDLNRHVDQVIRYAFHEGTHICVLTTGLEWWLYLPREAGPPSKRRFATLSIDNDPLEQLTDDFETFLGTESLLSGKAEKRAKQVLEAKRLVDRLNVELPKIWSGILAGPDDELVELVRRRAYGALNIRPTSEQVAAVIGGSPVPPTVQRSEPPPVPPKPTPRASPTAGRPRPTAVRLWGQRYDVENWTNMLVTVADALYGRHRADFDRVLDKRGRKHPWASRNSDDIPWAPKLVGSSGIYIETGFDARAMERRARGLLRLFGYDASELEILLDSAPARSSTPSPDSLPSDKPDRILLWSKHYPVKSWKDILFGVANALHDRYGDDFDRIVTNPPRGRGLPRASHSPGDIARSQPVGTTGLYMTRNWSRASLGRATVSMLEFFGHDASEINFVYDQGTAATDS